MHSITCLNLKSNGTVLGDTHDGALPLDMRPAARTVQSNNVVNEECQDAGAADRDVSQSGMFSLQNLCHMPDWDFSCLCLISVTFVSMSVVSCKGGCLLTGRVWDLIDSQTS